MNTVDIFHGYEYLISESHKGPSLFFDTARVDKNNYTSYLFSSPVDEIKAFQYDEVASALDRVDNVVKAHWVAGYIRYEAGYSFEKKFEPLRQKNSPRDKPLLWFGVFEEPIQWNHKTGQITGSLMPDGEGNRKVPANHPSEEVQVRSSIQFEEFEQSIQHIKECIARGETYQVNVSFANAVHSCDTPVQLYRQIREMQQVPYSALLNTPYESILSFSPELFFRRNKNTITVQPMKGTASRAHDAVADKEKRRELQTDQKNNAENIMIVDLLRNDIGRFCQTGTVRVPHLFKIESHQTVHQMTSVIQGKLRQGTSYKSIFEHIFPCGSVTGAPKIKTMEIINQLEQAPRGVYCGAIGFISPKKRAVFNVPIRTLEKGKKDNLWNFRVGSGIVWDSTAIGEWDECDVKKSFLTRRYPSFELLESILWKQDRLWYLREHVRRMKNSAQYFNIPFSRDALQKMCLEITSRLNGADPQKVRVLLFRDGVFKWEAQPLAAMSTDTSTVPGVFLSKSAINENELFLFHKTTWRPWYKDAMHWIKGNSCYDVLFFNRKREITEGARSNVFVRLQGTLYTPPIKAGILPGVLRSVLLKRKKCFERSLSVNDVRNAEEVYCGNSVRGLVRVGLE